MVREPAGRDPAVAAVPDRQGRSESGPGGREAGPQAGWLTRAPREPLLRPRTRDGLVRRTGEAAADLGLPAARLEAPRRLRLQHRVRRRNTQVRLVRQRPPPRLVSRPA